MSFISARDRCFMSEIDGKEFAHNGKKSDRDRARILCLIHASELRHKIETQGKLATLRAYQEAYKELPPEPKADLLDTLYDDYVLPATTRAVNRIHRRKPLTADPS